MILLLLCEISMGKACKLLLCSELSNHVLANSTLQVFKYFSRAFFCSIGIYNILKWNPTVIKALSPYYMYKYVRLTGIQGWLSFGGIVLCLTGTEAMFANLGHFSPMSIKIAFAGGVYPCIVLSYMGKELFLPKIKDTFFKASTSRCLVNVDECKLSVEILKSLNKDHDPEEEQIFRELNMELEEIDRCVSRTRFRKVVVRGSATRGRVSSTSTVRGGGRASTRASTTYVRRGSGSGSSTTATTLENVPLSRSMEPREPEFDDEGNIVGEGDYGFSSTHSNTSSDEDDTHDSDWETDTST
ncbi:hypothetical protein L7F22_069306 [Adiantum nelumboides]|nr:hypothetical protein [Adiantum nelumboides]